ncbi:MAG: sulfotransferase [Pseudonocardiaceae bacterium]
MPRTTPNPGRDPEWSTWRYGVSRKQRWGRPGCSRDVAGQVFGVGLSRTGTYSLTEVLHALGVDPIHYPKDRPTLETLLRGAVRFSLLKYYDGIIDITCAPSYADLDQRWLGSKFVLIIS